MNQGKLEVKQEMVRVNTDILGISELKWMGMGKFNSDDHYIYYCGQESLRRNGAVLIVNKRIQNAILGCNLKKTIEWSQSFPRQTIQHHSNPNLCPNHWCQRSRSWPVLWRPITPFRPNAKKWYPFHHRGLECKSRKSRDTWNDRQVWSQSTN